MYVCMFIKNLLALICFDLFVFVFFFDLQLVH